MTPVSVPLVVQRAVDAINAGSWRSRVFTGESTGIVTAVRDRIGSFRIPPHA
ncbi:hypothetical protein [Microbacterium sp. IEGM 1404]|uniref:hypothetical protein n=1 Tax=Microbacterium sp. IEGM 1404 TaxID=3047084 RepID=UPI0024B772A5|nr:hypothetical protein [Microbacterium sp. IEGM 1404]MDI9891053.1 hypothetical protein [Microbacterium sp. IEGM 1404]